LRRALEHIRKFHTKKDFFTACHVVGVFTEKPIKYLLTGSAKSGGDMSGELSSDFAKYLVRHEDSWFDTLSRSDKAEDQMCVKVRSGWPLHYRNVNISANRALFFLLVDVSIKKGTLGPIYERYAHLYGKSPITGSLDVSKVDSESQTIKIRIKQLSRFKSDLDQNKGFLEEFHLKFCNIRSTVSQKKAAKEIEDNDD
jgi:hypothetical protein